MYYTKTLESRGFGILLLESLHTRDFNNLIVQYLPNLTADLAA